MPASTPLAKLAANSKFVFEKRVSLISADTYRMSAIEHLTPRARGAEQANGARAARGASRKGGRFFRIRLMTQRPLASTLK